MLGSIADAMDWVDATDDARCVVLASEGKNFCAGADLAADNPRTTSEQADQGGGPGRHIYDECFRLFSAETPDRGCGQGSGGRRWARPGLHGRLPGRRARHEDDGQLRPVGLSSRLRTFGDPAPDRRRAEGHGSPLHREADQGATRPRPSASSTASSTTTTRSGPRPGPGRRRSPSRPRWPSNRSAGPCGEIWPAAVRAATDHEKARAGPPAPDQRLPGGRQGHGRAASAQLHPVLSNGPPGSAPGPARGTGTTAPAVTRWVMATSCSSTGRRSTMIPPVTPMRSTDGSSRARKRS